VLAPSASGRRERACPRLLEGQRRSDEVRNLKEVGASLRSGSKVRSDRHPVVPQTREATRLRTPSGSGEQAHEGRAQAQRLSWNTSEGEKVKRASARLYA
jgi:hypothetical protein